MEFKTIFLYYWTLILIVIGTLKGVECARGGGNDTLISAGFGSVVKQVIKKNMTVSSSSNNIGEPLKNSDRVRIIGGVETARNEFPFIVSFARHGRHFCGGSIIEPEWVLTAAHCASEADFDVTAGEHNLDAQEGTEQKSRATMVIRNANYNPITYEDDICLVKVSPPFNYNQYVRPFAVPSTHYVANGNATVAGWGTEDEAFQVVSPVLRKVSIPLVPSIECAAQYGSYFHPLKMMCAGEEEGGKDACQGDSGGPLMCDDYHKGATLCGVVSFGLGCARPELAGVYTKVAYYSDWIHFQMNSNSKQGGGITTTTRRTTRYYNRKPDTTTPTTPSPPKQGNPFDNIPPGYVVIIKPVNATRPPSVTERPRYNETKGKGRSGSLRVHASSLFDSGVLVLSVLLYLSLCFAKSASN